VLEPKRHVAPLELPSAGRWEPEARDAPGAALSREVGAGATGTRGAPGAALCWEAGAGAQVTHDGPRAALSREAGTTPPPPFPHRPTAPAPDPRRHRADLAAAA
jgi:hypothetical protein